MQKMTRWISIVAVALVTHVSMSVAAIQPEKIHVAEAKKTKAYLAEGMVVGGDRAINEVRIKDIRRAFNAAGYERVVIDLEGTRAGEPVAIPRPPYYQVAVSSGQQRLEFTIWGKPRLDFDAPRVVAAFRKSPMIDSVELYPRLDEDSWTFSVMLKPGKQAEVFELGTPVRIIVDIRDSGSQS